MAGLIPERIQSIGERVAPPDDPVLKAPKMGNVVVEIRPGVRVTITDQPIDDQSDEPPKDPHFDDNLAEDLAEGDLGTIAEDLLEGIDADIRSRSEFVSNYTRGLDLLGLKLESASVARGRRSTSKVFHPLLLWAIIEFQSGARAELYPASGPCKVSISGKDDAQLEERARDLQEDLNRYLTEDAPEYYPDADQGLFYLGYGGNIYKKVYRCPIRQRPVSECVYIPDLIVSNDAVDLLTAQRITHKMEKLDREIKQLMKLGLYRDVELVTPSPSEDPIKRKERDIQGRKAISDRPKDIPHTTYECYTFLDLSEHGKKEDGQTEGIPLPYRVTLDKDSRKVLEIRRNWKEGDDLFRRRKMLVKFGLVPGMGFLDYGLLHLLGNSTRALTALWRVGIDAGMFSNFPGGVRARGARTDTNELNPAPGEFVPVDTPGDDIRKVLMPMPYKDISPALLGLIQYIEKNATQIWGALKFAVGEGRTNIPVGSIMAMIEQQTQTMAAVHKRLHTAQAEELQLLKQLFAENPKDLWRFAKDPARRWETAEEFADMDLIPASDPNIPAQTHRIMQSAALSMLAQQNPSCYNQDQVQRRLLANIGISDIDSLLTTPQEQESQPPDPKAIAAIGKIQAQKDATQAQLQKAQIDHAGRMEEINAENQNRDQDRQSKEKVETMKLAGQVHQANRASETDLHSAHLGHAADIHATERGHAADLHKANTGLLAAMIPPPEKEEPDGA